jgi:hypothetical protein
MCLNKALGHHKLLKLLQVSGIYELGMRYHYSMRHSIIIWCFVDGGGKHCLRHCSRIAHKCLRQSWHMIYIIFMLIKPFSDHSELPCGWVHCHPGRDHSHQDRNGSSWVEGDHSELLCVYCRLTYSLRG